MSKLRNVSEEILVGAKFVEVGKSAKLTRGQLLMQKNAVVSMTSSKQQYYISSSKETLEGGFWQDVRPVIANGYVWTRTRYGYSDGKVTYTNPVYILKQDDVDVTFSTIEYYLVSNSTTGITRETEGWSTTPQQMTASLKYLWNYQERIFSDGSHDYSDPCIIGAYGDKGDDGFSFTITITSSNGSVFRLTDIDTTLSCHVYINVDEVTDDIDSSKFCWKRNTGNQTADEQWNTSSKALYHKSVNITPADCLGRTVFTCEVDLSDYE